MQSKIFTVAFEGIEAKLVTVQVLVSSGLPAFTIVGLPDKSVAESKERVRAALTSLGIGLPPKRITVNLAPADLPKEGAHYDLPIAMGILSALGVLPAEEMQEYLVLGELSLDGSCNKVAGILPSAIEAQAMEKSIICPKSGATEATWAGELEIIAPDNLLQLINHFKGSQVLSPPPKGSLHQLVHHPDLEDIKGQESAKRAIEVAAAGGHNILMSGPPGSGKSMLASRIPGILPPLSASEALEVNMINSVAGEMGDGDLSVVRPYRDPHHTASVASIIGGGRKAKPGEVSLSHNGILFLDEFPEFGRQSIEALRQPMESGKAVIARANAHITYPAKFQLVAAMNPCRCGHLDDAARACSRAPKCARDYFSKISGPMLDRFDIFIEVPKVDARYLLKSTKSETSNTVAKRVAEARHRQEQRFLGLTAGSKLRTNSEMEGKLLEENTALDNDCINILEQAIERLSLSARGYHRILKVARTIADLDGVEVILKHHLYEALEFRSRMISMKT